MTQAAFGNVRWLGGASGAGKTTIANRLARALDGISYSTDEAMTSHARRCAPGECPGLAEFAKMTMEERWVERSPAVMLDTFHWFNGEGFRFILEDLAAFPRDKLIIVEGFRLLPHLVKPHLAEVNHALWLIPTPEFRLLAFTARGTLWDIPNKTSRPEVALRNLLERDRLFSQRLQRDLAHADLSFMTVDGRVSEDELATEVAFHFGI